MVKYSKRLLLLLVVLLAGFTLAACGEEAEVITGPQGPAGAAGAVGPAGAAGAAGAAGVAGAAGKDGLSAYDLYKKNNTAYAGTEIVWLRELVENKLIVDLTYDTGAGAFLLTAKPAYAEFKLDASGNVTADRAIHKLFKGQVITLPDPFLDAHIFFGWYEDAALTKPFDLTKGILKTVDLFARYIPEDYKDLTEDFTIKSALAKADGLVEFKGIVTQKLNETTVFIQERILGDNPATTVVETNFVLSTSAVKVTGPIAHLAVGNEVILEGTKTGLNVVLADTKDVYVLAASKPVPTVVNITDVVVDADYVVADLASYLGKRVSLGSETAMLEIISITLPVSPATQTTFVLETEFNDQVTLVFDAKYANAITKTYIANFFKAGDFVSVRNAVLDTAGSTLFINDQTQLILELDGVVAGFRVTYAALLEVDIDVPAELAAITLAEVDAAIAAYNLLAQGVRNQLAPEKEILDALKVAKTPAA